MICVSHVTLWLVDFGDISEVGILSRFQRELLSSNALLTRRMINDGDDDRSYRGTLKMKQ